MHDPHAGFGWPFSETEFLPTMDRKHWNKEASGKLLHDFQALLPRVRAVSFDVFDTALQRILYPKEVFALVENKAVARFGDELRGFADERIEAERRARKNKKKNSGNSEVGFEAIYDELAFGRPEWAPRVRDLKAIELAEEARCSRDHPLGKQLWDIAASAGVQRCFISDMYLGARRIKSLLERNGYESPRVICSSDHGCNKSSGKLFHVAAGELGLEPSEILHIGDNVASDQLQAKRCGLKMLPFPPATTPPRQAKHFPEVSPEREAEAVCSGIIRCQRQSELWSERAQNALVEGDDMARAMGYSVLGPMVYGLCHWLVDRIASDQRDLVLFLGRDGYLPHKILADWQSRYGCLAHARLEYFPSSRRATALASAADGIGPLVRSTLGHHRRSVPLRDYFERIGLNPMDHLDAIQAAGFHSPEEMIHRSRDRPAMESLIELLEEPLRQLGAVERDALLQALGEKGLNDADRPAIFDLGWRGTQQACLQLILGESLDLHGYYLSISDTFAAAGTTTGYFVTDGHPGGLRGLFESATPVIELLYSSPEPSLLHYTKTHANVTPVYDSANPNRSAIEALQKGAQDFVGALTDFYKGPTAPLSKTAASSAFAKIAVEPSGGELAFLQSLEFSDALGREKGQALTAIQPPPLRSFLFDYEKFFEAYSETYWRADFIRNMSLPAKLWVWPRSPSFRRIWRMMRRWEYRFGGGNR